MQIGDEGQDVSDIQSALSEIGYGLMVDGIFGKQTEQTVKQFQRDNALPITGTVDDETFRIIKRIVEPGKLNYLPYIIILVGLITLIYYKPKH